MRAGRELIALRDKTQQAATVCGMVQGSPVVLDLIQGHTVIEFGTRPGTRLMLDESAHGKVWLAFSSGAPIERALARARDRRPDLIQEIAKVRHRGWATAPNEVIDGVHALAAPVFDHAARMIGSIAIVGATQFIASAPSRAQIDAVVGAARHLRALGGRTTDQWDIRWRSTSAVRSRTSCCGRSGRLTVDKTLTTAHDLI